MPDAPRLPAADRTLATTSWREGLAGAWRLARPFWTDRAQRGAWGQLALVIALTLGVVAVNVRISLWNNAFYDALQAKDLGAFWRQVGVFCALAVIYIVIAVYRLVVQQQLTIRWRQALTDRLLERWLRRGVAYRLPQQRHDGMPDNPDQRIADDARSFVSSTLSLSLGLLNASVTLVSFIGILWGLSGALPLGPWQVHGYMVWVAIVYSLGGSLLAQWIGRPLISTNARQQQVEADFRYQLVQVRDQAEAIALARGEPAEQRRLADLFAAIRGNWAQLIRNTKRLTWFSAGYGQLADIFPLLAAAPRYFSGAIQLGGLMQTAQAFGQVQGALSWFVDGYGDLADWRATVWRLTSFVDALASDRDPATAAAVQAVEPDAALTISRLAVSPPSAEPSAPPLLQVPTVWVQPGERVLVTGPSGAGKSTLLRALAGLIAPLEGTAEVPTGVMVVPQRPYLPHGTLAAALAYPSEPGRFGDGEMRRALRAAGLGALAGRLGTAAAWSQRLSPGEQQRLQFARILLKQPRWLMLDEVTSALDERAEQLLYTMLRDALPRTTIISIGHRPGLRRLHDVELAVQGGVLRRAARLTAAGTPPHQAAG